MYSYSSRSFSMPADVILFLFADAFAPIYRTECDYYHCYPLSVWCRYISLSPSPGTIGLSESLGNLEPQGRLGLTLLSPTIRRKFSDAQVTQCATNLCMFDVASHRLVRQMSTKKTRPMSRWCWWLQQPVGKPRSRNETVRRVWNWNSTCMFVQKERLEDNLKEAKKGNPSNSFHRHPLVESPNPYKSCRWRLRIDLRRGFFTCFYQAQHGAETKQHKNDVQFFSTSFVSMSVDFEEIGYSKLKSQHGQAT